VSDQIYAVDNQRPDSAELTALQGSLEKHRLFRLDQLSEIALTTKSRGGRAGSQYAVAHAEVCHQLAATALMVLAETDAALLRIEAGQYGRCDRCGSTIEIQRLRIHPQTRYCMRCHHALETQQ
jgi:RNA polymerase-binding transcription factor DksA